MTGPPLPTLPFLLLAVAVFAALVFTAKRSRVWTAAPGRVAALLAHRGAPWAVAALTFLAVRAVWGSFSEPGVVHDERAYLLQAAIFARGHWTAPSPPLPEFFEQMHVFVEPAVFAKYPPAHALMLVPGIWLGLPGLMPAVLAALSGALIFALARRLAGAWTAILTWWLWATAWVTLYWAASYFSEATSTTMWLVALWATERWLDTRRPQHLIALAAALAWGANARPLTMAALSVPLAFVIGRRAWHDRSRIAHEWKIVGVAVFAGGALLFLGPLWNDRTLGDWRLTPYAHYSTVYFPFDKPGFGVDEAPPLRPVPPEMAAVGYWSRWVHEGHVPAALPSILVARVMALLFWFSEGWRAALAVLVLGALLRPSPAERFGLICIGVLFAAYLLFAHPAMWVVYYVEILPVCFFLAASQLGRLFHRLGGSGHLEGSAWPPTAANAALVAMAIVVPLGIVDIARVRTAIDGRNDFHRKAVQTLDAVPGKAVVFVRYPGRHNHHLSLARNEPDLAAAPRWIVTDRGNRNKELRALAPDRSAYLLDAATLKLEALAPLNADAFDFHISSWAADDPSR
jgi:hypothetical protein